MFLVGMVAFLLLVFIGIPVAFSFAIVGFVGVILVRSLDTAFALLGSAPLAWASDVNLVAVPLFILMGQFALHSGISGDLFEAAHKWLGRLPGGLALATNLASTGFAACTGSALASGATMASIAYPEMKRFHYDDRLATGSVAAGGTLGILIPPSIAFIVYGFITETDIGRLFIAGIFPGLMLSGMFVALILVMCKQNPRLGPTGLSYPWRQRLASLRGVWGMLALLLLVIGGLYFGVFAPSEAGAIGAFGAFLIALVRRRLTIPNLITALKDSLRITSIILTIVIGAMIFGTFVAASGFTTMFGRWVATVPLPPFAIVVAILIIYIPLGMLIDAIPMMLLTMPIVFPAIQNLGFDLVWFGVLVILMSQVAFISPPVGLVAYVVQGVTKVPLQDVFRGNMPFILAILLCVGILLAFPQISLFLPNIMR
jgi:tripartite ATP-independent transporter DctM subunit